MQLLSDTARARASTAADEVMERLPHLQHLRHQLLLIVGGRSAGKTLCLHEVADRTGAQVVNLGLELSRRLLELTPRERPLRVAQHFRETALGRSGKTPEPVLLDNIEILFTPKVKQNPLGLLKSLTSDRVVVATSPGPVLRNSRQRRGASSHPAEVTA